MTDTAKKSWEEILAEAAAAGPADDPLADPAEAELQKRLAEARTLLDGLRPVKNPERFLDPDAVEAAAVVREHDRPYFWRLKAELRPHKILRDWERAVGSVAKEMGAAEIKVAEKTQTDRASRPSCWTFGTIAATAWCWPVKAWGPGCCWRVRERARRGGTCCAAYGRQHQFTLEDGAQFAGGAVPPGGGRGDGRARGGGFDGEHRAEPVLPASEEIGDRIVIDRAATPTRWS